MLPGFKRNRSSPNRNKTNEWTTWSIWFRNGDVSGEGKHVNLRDLVLSILHALLVGAKCQNLQTTACQPTHSIQIHLLLFHTNIIMSWYPEAPCSPDSISRRSMFSPSHTSHPRHFSTPWGHDLLMVCCDMSECWTSWYDNASFSRCCKRSAATNLRLSRNDHNFTTEDKSLAITGTMCGGFSKIAVALKDHLINPQLCCCYPLWSFGLRLFWRPPHIYTWPKIKLFSVHLVACWIIPNHGNQNW